jgi:hypothetical protein
MDIFLDTEFVGFESLEPLSIAFYPIDPNLQSAYFELDTDEVDLSSLTEENHNFMASEVLPQLNVADSLSALVGSGVRVCRDTHSQLTSQIFSYLQQCSLVAAEQKDKVWLVSDYQGDFEVLKKFVDQELLNSLWIRQIMIKQVVPENWRAEAAYVRCQNALFAEGLELTPTVKLQRHHAYFDAFVMCESYKQALLHAL